MLHFISLKCSCDAETMAEHIAMIHISWILDCERAIKLKLCAHRGQPFEGI